MAPRVQAQYDPRGTGLRPVVAREVAPVQPQFQTPQVTPAMRLAEALGAVDYNALRRTNEQNQLLDEEEERRKAREFANSITLEELGKKIRSGEMLPSQSPVFAATVQNIYGENAQKALERDVLSKLASGELKFNSPQELDEYLTQARNEYLEEQSPYTIAGFDRGWNNLRAKAADTLVKINDVEAVNRGIAEASDNLANVLLDVTSPTFQGTDADRAKELMRRYELLTATQLLRNDARKEAISNLMTRIAASGNRSLLDEMLKQRLPGNGPTIAGLLGDRQAVALANTTEAQFDKDQRQRVDVELAPFLRQAATGQLNLEQLEKWRQANEKYVSSSTIESLIRANEAAQARLENQIAEHEAMMEAQRITYEAAQRASSLVAARRGYEMPDIEIPTPNGGTKTIKGADLVLAEVERRIAAEPDMPFDEQVRLYANNSAENKQWKAEINAAYVNLGEVGVDAKGKPVGELLPATLEALDRFAIINQISTGYARQLAGGEAQYQALVNLQALREAGVADPNLAASLVNQAERNTAKNIESISAEVRSAVNDVINPGITTLRFWSELLSGEWGEGEKNVRPMEGAIYSLAKAYMAANIVTSGKDAVRLATEYYANPAVTTQVYNAVYLNKDLPRVPENQDQRTWFKRFMDEKVAEDLKGMGVEYDADDVYLHPMRGGEGQFMLHLKGVPLGRSYLRRDIEQWIIETDKKDIAERIRKKNEPKQEQFIQSDTPGGASLIYRNPKR